MSKDGSEQVSLVGAGPGDPDLITLKGIRRIEEADIIFHDKLSPDELIDRHAPDNAMIVDVGKRKGKVGPTQEEINQKLVDASKKYKRIVRLKGGDPYLFGRGGEEAEFLRDHGVPFEVIPGISSLLSVPNYAGIPATHRDHASSLAVVTGHPGPKNDEPNWDALAEIDSLVVMMGITRADEIARRLIRAGRSPETPAAVIGLGTTPRQTSKTLSLEQLQEGLDNPGDYLPGLIVIGEVARLRDRLNWFESGPLFGKRIIVTRPARQNESMATALREQGAQPLCHPTIRIEAIDEGLQELSDRIRQKTGYDWLIFTSRNGVRFFFEALHEIGGDTRALGSMEVATIGSGTAEECSKYGCRPDLIPDSFEAESLADELIDVTDESSHFLLPRAEGARKILPEQLRDLGHTVDEIITYRSVPATEPSREPVRQIFENNEADMITFTSASTVDSLFQMFPEETDWIRTSLKQIDCACIGPITAERLQSHRIDVEVIPDQYTINDFLDAIHGFYQRKEEMS